MTKRVPPFPELTTKRLKLRRGGPDDFDVLHACFSDPQAMSFWGCPVSKSTIESERLLAIFAKTSSPYDHFAWAITDKKSGRCFGIVNYHHREQRHRRLEIGYIVSAADRRRGIATEAVAAMLDFCERELKVHRFNALIAPENAASIRLVERLGFTCEGGPLRDYWCVNGVFQSVMIYGRLGAP